MLRLDYLHVAHSTPVAHWTVHAERGATSVLLARCNPRHEGLLSQVHIPVGGPRYRPCLEDFLERLVVEFNIDARPGWENAVENGRQTWRETQTRAVVRDSPEIAAEVLRRQGYTVTAAADPPAQNRSMLRAR
ncbi:hypothetical protein LY13_004531 [Prauserella aidingensis]|uniref:hypothetical protein n=1 Tax=Prauserella aidingensis TaxID=387890 RepID=UPI0020A26F73|nr:hypothetical protein [Prauserella aidingensis]MCP2255749.1 hypothetical protein [Prauserella aidingensis]